MSIHSDQKAVKPKIEDVAGDFLAAERAADIGNLVEFIRANKIGIRWVSGNSWALFYKNRQLGFLKIRYVECEEMSGKSNPFHKSWVFCHRRDYLERYYSMEDCELKSFLFDHIYAKNCGYCICGWHLKEKASLNEQKAGYMNPTECGCYPLRIYSPTGEALEFTKRLIELRMKYILEDSK